MSIRREYESLFNQAVLARPFSLFDPDTQSRISAFEQLTNRGIYSRTQVYPLIPPNQSRSLSYPNTKNAAKPRSNPKSQKASSNPLHKRKPLKLGKPTPQNSSFKPPTHFHSYFRERRSSAPHPHSHRSPPQIPTPNSSPSSPAYLRPPVQP